MRFKIIRLPNWLKKLVFFNTTLRAHQDSFKEELENLKYYFLTKHVWKVTYLENKKLQ